MKIVLLDSDYTIVHEFEDVKAPKSPKKWNHRVLTYRGKSYVYHGTDEGDDELPDTHTFVEAEVISLNVTLGGST